MKLQTLKTQIRIDSLNITFPISKQSAARIMGVHLNQFTKWCKMSEFHPVMKRTQYKRRSKFLTEEQFFTIVKIIRFKAILSEFKELEDGSHIPIYPKDRRIFNNQFLFPVYAAEYYSQRQPNNHLKINLQNNGFPFPNEFYSLKNYNSIRKTMNGKIKSLNVYDRRKRTIKTIDHEL